MTPELITLIFNIIFFVIIGIILIKAIWGLKQGLWKTSTAFIVSIIFYAIIILLNTTFTGLYYKINLSGLNINLVINEQSIDVNTIGQTIRDVVIALSGESIELSHESEIFAICDALAKSFLALFVFVIHFLVVSLIIAPIISTILYKLVVEPLLGKNFANKKKIRLAGFAVNALKCCLTLSLFISPFSALLNKVSDTANDRDLSTNENAQLFKNYVDAYDQSLFGKVFSGVSGDSDSFDVVLTEYVTSFQMGDDVTSILKETGIFLDIAMDGIEQNVIDVSSFTIDYVNLLKEEFITQALIKLASSNLVTTVLPVALGIVSNLEAIKENIDISEVEWDEIDWSDDLNALSDIYSEFYDTGIIDYLVVDEADINDLVINRDKYDSFVKTFEGIEKVSVLNAVMPYVLSSFAKSLEGQELEGLLPTDVESYKNVNLGKELGAIYESVVTLSDLATYSELDRHLTIGDLGGDNLNLVLDFALSKNGVGTDDKEFTCYSTDVKHAEISTIAVFNGYDVEGVHRSGLLDSTLLADNIDTLLKYVVNTEGLKEYELAEPIDEAVVKIEKTEDPVATWKQEIDSLLHIVPVFYNNPNLPLEGDINIFDREVTSEIKKITPYVDNSILVNELAGPMITKMMGENELIGGIYAKDLDFNCGQLGTELGHLLDVLPLIGDLTSILQNENGIETLLTPYDDSDPSNVVGYDMANLEILLTTVYNSKILNPKVVVDSPAVNSLRKAQSTPLSNFEKIIQSVFSDPQFEELGINIGDNFDEIREKGWVLEISDICNAFETLQYSDSLQDIIFAEEGYEFSLNDIDHTEIEPIFSALAQSNLIEPCLGSMFNKFLGESLASLNMNIDFRVVEDWSGEGESFANIIYSIQELDKNGFSISSIDLAALNYINDDGSTGVDDLKDILVSLVRLQSISNEFDSDENIVESTNFGDFIYENITASENGLGSFLDGVDDSVMEQIRDDHTFKEHTESEMVLYDENTYLMWHTDDNKGVIDRLCEMLEIIVFTADYDGEQVFFNNGSLDINKALSFEEKCYDLDGNEIEIIDSLLKSLNKIYIFRTLFVEVVDNTIQDMEIQMDGIHMDKVNTNLFRTELNYQYSNDDEVVYPADEVSIREKELNSVIDIYDNLEVITTAIEENGVSSTLIEDYEDEFTTLLESMAVSKLFNEGGYVSDDNPSSSTFFEDLIVAILDNVDLSSKMANTTSQDIAHKHVFNSIKMLDNEIKLDTSTGVYYNEWATSDHQAREVFYYVKAIKSANEINTQLSSGSLESLDDTSIVGECINSFVDSKVFRYENSVGNILTNQIDTSSFEELGLYIDFTQVGYGYGLEDGDLIGKTEEEILIKEWKLEADNLVHLLDNLCYFNSDEVLDSAPLENSDKYIEFDGKYYKKGLISLDIDISSLSTSDEMFDFKMKILEDVFVSIHDLCVVKACDEFSLDSNGIDNFGSFIYTKVTSTVFSSYSEINDASVLSDHNLGTDDELYYINNGVNYYASWKNPNFASLNGASYNGEISNIIKLIKFAQTNLADGNGGYDLTSATEDVVVLEELLNDINDIYCFRSLFGILIKNSTADMAIDGLDMNKINSDIFDDELSYKENSVLEYRLNEINKRSVEIEGVVQIFEKVDSMSDLFSSTEISLDDVVSYEEDLKELLDSLSSSKLFNENGYPSEGYSVSTTFFQDVVVLILEKGGVSEIMLPENSSLSAKENSINAVASIKNESSEVNGWTYSENHRFIKALTTAASCAGPLMEGGSMDQLNPKDLNATIDAFAASSVFFYQNGLGHILYNNLDTSSLENMGLVMDFRKVGEDESTRINDWDLEGDNLESLMVNLQYFNTDFAEAVDVNPNDEDNYRGYDFDNDNDIDRWYKKGLLSFDIDFGLSDPNEVGDDNFNFSLLMLKNVLNTMHGLQVVQNNNDTSLKDDGVTYNEYDNFGNFIYSNVTTTVFASYLIDVNQKEGESYDDFLKRQNDLLNLKLSLSDDHKLDINEYEYDDSSSVKWDEDECSYNGEINNIIEMIRFAQYNLRSEDADGNASYDLNLITGDNYDVNKFEEVLTIMNKTYAFRSMVRTLIEEQLAGNNIRLDSTMEIDFTKADTEIFDEEYNYRYTGSSPLREVENRFEEIEARYQELLTLNEVFYHATVINNDLSSKIDNGNQVSIQDFAQICESDGTPGNHGTIASLLENMHDARIFYYNNSEVALSELTIFEDMVKHIIVRAGIDDMIDTNDATRDDTVHDVIHFVSSAEERNPTGNVVWKTGEGSAKRGEIYDFNKLLYAATHLDDGQIFITLEDTTELSAGNLEKILRSANESYLCHRLMGNCIDETYSGKGNYTGAISIKDYILNPDETVIDAHCIDDDIINAELDVSKNEIDERSRIFPLQAVAWEQEITMLLEVFDLFKDGVDGITAPESSSDSINTHIFVDVLPYLMRLKSLGEGKYDILYGIVVTNAGLEIDEFDYSSASTHEEKQRDLLIYLFDTYINIEEDVYNEDYSINNDKLISDDLYYESITLDNVANILLSNVDSSLDGANGTDTVTGDVVSTLISNTYSYDSLLTISSSYEERYHRGYLASEVVSYLVQDMITNLDSSLSVNLRRGYTYKGLNRFEADGIKGLLDLALLLESFNDYSITDVDLWKEEFMASTRLMGNKDDVEERYEYLFISNINQYNSIIALTLFNKLVADDITSIEQKIALANLYLENDISMDWSITIDASFEEKGEVWASDLSNAYNTLSSLI